MLDSAYVKHASSLIGDSALDNVLYFAVLLMRERLVVPLATQIECRVLKVYCKLSKLGAGFTCLYWALQKF